MDTSSEKLARRDALKIGGAVMAGTLAEAAVPFRLVAQASGTAKKKSVVIAGAGIAGLSCAWELVRRGHEVTLLEAAGRAGGHVKTMHDPLADGLYADLGAEQFTKPGYDLYWGYVREFNLEYLPYTRRDHLGAYINDRYYTREQLRDPAVLRQLGFNEREAQYIAAHGRQDLQMLFFEPYLDRFKDEYKPFEAGLNDLDQVPMRQFLIQQHASPAAVAALGGDHSTLHAMWRAAILKLRGVPQFPMGLFRLKGGNQVLPDTFANELRDRIHYSAPLTAIEHGDSGVTVHYTEFGEPKRLDADYLVCCMNAPMLLQIPVTPALPEAKHLGLRNTAYYTQTGIVFQTYDKFWQEDRVSPDFDSSDPSLELCWQTATEVPTRRGMLIGRGSAGTSAKQALAAFRKLYPGKSHRVENTLVYDWSQNRWASMCETLEYPTGVLTKVWPAIIEPVGRIFFAGAYADNMNWGQEAATRSANRVARQINQA
jgi:monoamine oxidase